MKKFTEKHKKKLSEAHKGKPGYWTGKKRPDISKKLTGRNITWKKKISKANKGKIPWNKGKKTGPLSEEHKQKISQSISTVFRNRPTKIETIVYEELNKRNIKFEKQYLVGRFIVDAYIPKDNLIIEVDGIYWHSLENIIKRDKARDAYFKKCGYNLLRIKEEVIHTGEFKSFLDNIKKD